MRIAVIAAFLPAACCGTVPVLVLAHHIPVSTTWLVFAFLETLLRSASPTNIKMKARRVVKKETADFKENIPEANGKGNKKADVAIIKGENEKVELKGEKKSMSTPVASPKVSRSKEYPSVVTPMDDEKKVPTTKKSPGKKGSNKAFGNKTLTEDFEEDVTVARKAPVEVSPLVDIVYRYEAMCKTRRDTKMTLPSLF